MKRVRSAVAASWRLRPRCRCVAAIARRAVGPDARSRAAVASTLDEAIAAWPRDEPPPGRSIARGEAAEAVVGTRHAATLPQVAAQAGYTRTNHVDAFGILLPNNQLRVIYPDIPDNYRTRLDLQWPIYTGGRLDALERAARIEATRVGRRNRRGARRSAARDHARVLGARHRRRGAARRRRVA